MAMRNTRVRKKLFIDSKVQGALLRRLLANWIVALVFGFVGLFCVQLSQHGIDKPWDFYLSQMWDDYRIAFVLLVLALPAIAYDSVKLSHRFAGPHYAIRMALRKLVDGEPIKRVCLRKHDFWTDVADDINTLAKQLDLIQNSSNTPVEAPAPVEEEDAAKNEAELV